MEEEKNQKKAEKDKENEAKKKSLLKELNSKMGTPELTTDSVNQYAVDWMELADVDKNGVLTLQEFTEFFSHLEGIVMTEEEIENVFTDIDENDNGTLTYEEFAEAIRRAILSDEPDDASSEEDEEDIQFD